MDPLELARTIEARFEEDPELAQTLVSSRDMRETIDPRSVRRAGQGHLSERGAAAIGALRAQGGSIDDRIALHQTIGEGGMGVVHLATQATLGRHVAVKTLREGVGPEQATIRVLREAWVTGNLEHPNVVPVYDVGVDGGGRPVIVMKRIEGKAWSDVMRAPPEGTPDALEWNLGIFEQVCNAVAFAHSRGILHRDLKPDNVMIGAFGEVYVLDWGIAVSLNDDPTGRFPAAKDARELAGTLCYMAPEMLLGDPTLLSERTDVYLLGAVLFEIFAGRPPHEGNDVRALMASALLSEPKFPAGFPHEARAICARAMSRDPAARYENAAALRAEVVGYVRHRGSRRIAHEAKQSLLRLLHAIEHEPPGEDRKLAIFNLLGECRFGYRSALSAWPANEAARRGLDRALLAVVDHELAEGDAHAAAALLREVKDPPPTVAAKVEAAVKSRAEQDERLRRMETDLDARVGTRTRTFAATLFGTIWTCLSAAEWIAHARGWAGPSYPVLIGWSLAFLLLGLIVYAWARETLTKTLLNRRVSYTLALQLVMQILASAGAWAAGIDPAKGFLLLPFSWALTEALLGIWVERWFFAPAVVSGTSFVVAAARPSWTFGLTTLDNLVLMAVMVLVWFPRQDIERIREHRKELRRRARKWLEEGGIPLPKIDEDDG
jgi:serine/threonine-protein kinase